MRRDETVDPFRHRRESRKVAVKAQHPLVSGDAGKQPEHCFRAHVSSRGRAVFNGAQGLGSNSVFNAVTRQRPPELDPHAAKGALAVEDKDRAGKLAIHLSITNIQTPELVDWHQCSGCSDTCRIYEFSSILLKTIGLFFGIPPAFMEV